ncbi:hypothetical protein P280DRAFT_522885 [Massarina eburnea CBS 473.64]|uniref:Uncharacterized protein n=1 Tax=Massarina eburnea CBS 473.64 TaxID=1395130 RepID=A0A6A6RNM1_9PLEO|nr:hypothetical protein P280DRAFT_522885 [Massarina eburnea CBS 473.64]
MRSVSFIVALLFALVGFSAAFPQFHMLEARKGNKNDTSASAKGNGTKGNSVNKMCKQMAKLTKLTELASNQTKMDALVSKGKLNDTEVTSLKSKAAEAETKLKTMTSNSTLVSECAVVDAHQETIGQCKQMKGLSKLASLASNQTAMDAWVAKKKLNDTQVTKFKDQISKAQTKLDSLNGNTTLTDICSKETSQKGASGTGATQAGTASTTAASSASALTLQSMPYIFVPAIGAVFALFL